MKLWKLLLFATASLLFIKTEISAFDLNIPDPEIAVDYSIITDEKISILEIAAVYLFPEGFHQTHNEDFFKVSVSDSDSVNNKTENAFRIFYPEGKIENGIVNYYDSAVITLQAELSSLPPGVHAFEVKAYYQLCDDQGVCYFPGSETFQLTVSIPESETTAVFSISGLINLLKYLLFAAAGGLLLNIMPCVFPLLSIKALTLVNQGSENRKKIFLSSAVYSAGIISSLVILAFIVIMLRKAGNFAGWGFQMQSQWFVITMITVIYLFALSMFDVFIITLPGHSAAGKAASIKGYGGHFLTGIFAVVVAAPCTAPFLGSAVAFAFYQSSITIILMFVFIGIGFSLPFLLLGFFPGIIKKIPSLGVWSVIFKEILGFVLAGTALYFLSAYATGKDSGTIVRLIIFMFIVTFTAWFFGKAAYPGAGIKKTAFAAAFSIILIAISANILLSKGNNSDLPVYASSKQELHVRKFTNVMLQSLLRENIPVFVDIYADWCTTCKINEQFVLGSAEIKEFFIENNIILLKGDFTGNDPDIAEWMRANKKAGVPVYAYYHPSTMGNKPVFFPEILRKDSLIENILIYSQK